LLLNIRELPKKLHYQIFDGIMRLGLDLNPDVEFDIVGKWLKKYGPKV